MSGYMYCDGSCEVTYGVKLSMPFQCYIDDHKQYFNELNIGWCLVHYRVKHTMYAHDVEVVSQSRGTGLIGSSLTNVVMSISTIRKVHS